MRRQGDDGAFGALAGLFLDVSVLPAASCGRGPVGLAQWTAEVAA